ncbi:hypothetical protein GWP43_06745 [Treponema vincentii]|uniref:Uncharacterized protein n=1 Tax=Treponema vincentii TaxID=69710 RepID=A0A6P1Y080_9SPIR|nr:hypothetical protein GWP43_06745 [Treponema vincentii]
MINSSAGIQPHCLSAEFVFRQTSHYYMCFLTALQKHGKNSFRKLIFAAKRFYWRLSYEKNGTSIFRSVESCDNR